MRTKKSAAKHPCTLAKGALLFTFSFPVFAVAQANAIDPVSPVNKTTEVADSLETNPLPEAPQPTSSSLVAQDGPVNGGSAKLPPAPILSKFIPANRSAQPLSAADKMRLGAKDLVSLGNFSAMIFSSGYEQGTNTLPNYGTNSEAFAQRIGAGAFRETTQGILSDVIFSPLLHEDPRYHQLGRGHSLKQRLGYSITRPLITRKDDGTPTWNGQLLLGHAAAAGLTPLIYPADNRNARDVISVWASSIGGAALGYFLSEFEGDALRAVHLGRFANDR